MGLYVIEMGDHRAIATTLTGAVKKGYQWKDLGATIWEIKGTTMTKIGWVVLQPVKDSMSRKSYRPLPVFYKADRNENPISVHPINSSGIVGAKIDLLDVKNYKNPYFVTSPLYESIKQGKGSVKLDNGVILSKAQREEFAIRELFHRTDRYRN